MKIVSLSLFWIFMVLDGHAAICNLNVTPLTFGSYDVFLATPTDTVSQIDVSCNTRTDVSLALSEGTGSYSQRYMVSVKGDNLNYNIYRNAARSQILGNGTLGTRILTANNIRNRSFTIYGRIPARQNVRAGTYTDTIIVTLTF